MAPLKLLSLFFPIFIHFFVPIIAQTNMLKYICSETGNFTTKSNYQRNLNALVSSFASNTKIDYGFYNGSKGQKDDQVNAISLCRGDKKSKTCRSCIKNSSQVLAQFCPNQKEAYIWYDDCLFRYSDRYIFRSMEFGPYFWMYNMINVTDTEKDEFRGVRDSLIGNLTNLAALGDSRRKFAAGNTTTKNSHRTIYALVQCTPDLSEQECSDCLNKATKLIPSCCDDSQGGRVVSPSCHFRYEKDPFYDLAATTLRPSPAPRTMNKPTGV